MKYLVAAGIVIAMFFLIYYSSILPGPPDVIASAIAQKKESDNCKTYYDKAKELAEKSSKDLPPGITMDFDPRMAESNASIAYSQIYRNCKKYGE